MKVPTKDIRQSSFKLFVRPALSLHCVKRSIKIALVVGKILGIINHGPAIIADTMTTIRYLSLLLTYLVPYGVATYGSAREAMYHNVIPGQKSEQLPYQ